MSGDDLSRCAFRFVSRSMPRSSRNCGGVASTPFRPLDTRAKRTWPLYIHIYIYTAHLAIYMLIHWDGTRRLHLGISPETGVSGPCRQAASLSYIRTFIPPYTRNLSPLVSRAYKHLTVYTHGVHTRGGGDAGVRVYRGGGASFGGGTRVTRHFQFVSPC